ncbi:MAG: hypothetical protein ABW175_17210 [Bradyrhizobium sp.]
MTIRFEALKARLLSNPEFEAEYDAIGPEFDKACRKELEETSHTTNDSVTRK